MNPQQPPTNDQTPGDSGDRRFFDGLVVVATGTATGIGAAVADALAATEAEVHTLDIAQRNDRGNGGTRSHRVDHGCDLGDRAAIDRVAADLPAKVDVLLNCAGIPSGGRFTPKQIMAVNWLGLRHLTEIMLKRMTAGAAVVHIASTAGRKWPERQATMVELMTADNFNAGAEWVTANSDTVADGYTLSKEAVQYYTMWRAAQLLGRGIRMNSVCPGVTDTALVDDFRRGLGDEVIDNAVAVAGRMGTPAEMASAMMFLADNTRSGYINGVNLNVDGGTAAHRATAPSR